MNAVIKHNIHQQYLGYSAAWDPATVTSQRGEALNYFCESIKLRLKLDDDEEAHEDNLFNLYDSIVAFTIVSEGRIA